MPTFHYIRPWTTFDVIFPRPYKLIPNVCISVIYYYYTSIFAYPTRMNTKKISQINHLCDFIEYSNGQRYNKIQKRKEENDRKQSQNSAHHIGAEWKNNNLINRCDVAVNWIEIHLTDITSNTIISAHSSAIILVFLQLKHTSIYQTFSSRFMCTRSQHKCAHL